jgi:hypothetical protein
VRVTLLKAAPERTPGAAESRTHPIVRSWRCPDMSMPDIMLDMMPGMVML